MRLIVMFVTLFGFWLLLSGIYKPWLVISGGVITVATIVFTVRNRIVDAEGFPAEKLPRGLVYWPWLLWQMVLSSLNVARIILDPRLPISPTMVRVDAGQSRAVGLVTYANSITLTPGTLSVEVSQARKQIWVHAITRANAEGLAGDDAMNRKVAWMEGDG